MLSNNDVLWPEDLELLAKDMNLEHPDYDRLSTYVSIVRTYNQEDQESYARENLAKWIMEEEECYNGAHESVEEFVRWWLSDMAQTNIPNYVAIDYWQTWIDGFDDFHYEDGAGHVWSGIY